MNIIDNVIPTEATRNNVRLMLPILVYWAKTGQKNHTYGDLIRNIGKSKFTGIGHALYAVQTVLNALSEKTGREIPTLNSLCKNSMTKLPSEGFEFVSPDYNNLDDKGKAVFIEGLDSKAISYPYWDWVLNKLGLEKFVPFTTEDLDAIKNPVREFGGEGKEHRILKEYICQHPECIGYKDVVISRNEQILPSGDRMDVYFELLNGTHVCVEVKSDISTEEEINRGIFQCVKYYAVMDALRAIECLDYVIDVILVTSSCFSPLNRKLAEELGVDYIDSFRID